MSILLIVWLSFLALVILLAVLTLIRNDWVFRNRVKMVWDDFEGFKQLPSYEAMLFRFWVWDVKKFLKNK